MFPIVDGVESQLSGKVNFYRFNVAELRVEELQQGYGLRGHPSFVVFDAQGKATRTLSGPQSADVLWTVLSAVTVES